MSDRDLLDRVHDHLGRYVAFPGANEQVAATLWVAHTHDLDAFESTPRLAFLSPEPGSGKTRALEVLDTLVPNPLHVLSASPAAIFRTIAAGRPTLLLDEVDAVFGRRGKDENNEDLRALLNAGHRAGATIPRCVGPSHAVTKFEVYAAVALAGLGDLPDTLMTRSVVIRMRRRAPGEYVQPFRARLDEPLGHALRDELEEWASARHGELREIPVMPPGVEDRPADVWEPLLAVADAAGGHWPGSGRSACSALAKAGVSREASLGIRLLTDLHTVFNGEDKLPTTTILERLHGLDESPWDDLRGKPLDARGLAYRLGQYGITSKNVVVGDTRPKGYSSEDLHDAWRRYLPQHDHPDVEQHDHLDGGGRGPGVPDSATSATSATSPPEVAAVAAVADLRTQEEDVDPFDILLIGGDR